nr:glycosyltransferase family 25 protein [Limnohabitans sp. T6-5]
MTEFSCACYVINLDRSPDRMNRIADNLQKIGLAYERHPAVDGRGLDLCSQLDFDATGYARMHGKRPVANEVGCYLSHMNAIKRFLQTDEKYCLILEDDALLPTDLLEVLQQVLSSPAQGDLTLLYGNRRMVALPVARLSGRRNIVGYWGKQTGAVAYLINRKAAKAFLHHMLPMRLPLDHAFSQVWAMGIRIRGVHPFPVTTGAFDSVIGKTGEKFPLRHRFQTLRFRFLSEMRRYKYQMFQDRIFLEAIRYLRRKS